MGEINVAFGWIWLNIGIVMGMVMGLWSFDGPLKTPRGHEDYSSLPRRLVRLSHVAFIVPSIINILYGKEIGSLHISAGLKTLGSWSMILAAAGISIGCLATAFWNRLKYLLAIPATLFLTATLIMAWGVLQ